MKIRKKMKKAIALMLCAMMFMSVGSVSHASEAVTDENYVTDIETEAEITSQDGESDSAIEESMTDENVTEEKMAADVSADETSDQAVENEKENEEENKVAVTTADEDTDASVQDEPTLADNKIGGTKETDYSLYMANGESFVNVGDTSVSAYLSVDKRFFEVEDITMILEIRQYNSEGYTVVGEVTYDYNELQELKAKASSETEKAYVFNSIEIPVAEGKSFNEGWAEYCVVKFSRPSWTNAEGKPAYRWTYTGDATVLAADKKAPSPIVWLYNLDENSHRGALIRSILSELGIPAGTVNNENLNQNIGYLVEWEGYEPVEDPYSSESYDVEYILMGNLTEVQLDDFIDVMQENNIRVNLKSVPTAWTAGKTFAELFDIMAEEDEVLKAAIALDEMIYTAEALDEATYGDSEYWDEFKKALDEAIVALSQDAEESEEGAGLYLNARDHLLEMYLKVTGKVQLAGELEFICEEQADGTYKVTARLNGEQTDATFDYSWKPTGSTEESITLSADQLYKVNLEINGTGKYYGELSAKLSVPGRPEYDVTSTKTTITVDLKDYENVANTPAVAGYTAELYLDGELVDTKSGQPADVLTFENLTDNTEYVVKVSANNIVGRSDIVEKTITTGEEVVNPDAGTTPDEEDGVVDEQPEDVEDDEQSTEENVSDEKFEESEETTENTNSVKTGDNSFALLWAMMAIAAIGLGTTTVVLKRRK